MVNPIAALAARPDAVARSVAAVVDTAAAAAKAVINRYLPDPVKQLEAQAAIDQALHEADYRAAQLQMSAILAEASSADPWTSRARPAFLYVMYGVIVLCVAGAIVGVWRPLEVAMAADNLGKLLTAIPDSLWWLFGTGYLGYTGARSFEKLKVRS